MNNPEKNPPARSLARQRLFFALWPEAALQTLIFNAAQALKISPGRLLPIDNLHLTLLFLGQVGEEQQHCLEQAANSLIFPRFELSFGELVFRRKQRMLWLQPDVTPDTLRALVAGLRQIAADCGLNIDPPPFIAHMTLLRKVTQLAPNAPSPDVVWPLREFALVASKTLPTGAQYQIVKKWSLTG